MRYSAKLLKRCEMQPFYWRFLWWQAKAHQGLKHFDLAARDLEKAIELAPQLSLVELGLEHAQVLIKLGELSHALSRLEAIEQKLILDKTENSENDKYQRLLSAKAEARLGNASKALWLLKALEQEHFESELLHFELRLELARNARELMQPSQAKNYYQETLKLAKILLEPKEKFELNYEYHQLLLESGHPDDLLAAYNYLEELLSANDYEVDSPEPEYVGRIYLDFAKASYRLGQLSEAGYYAEAALEQGFVFEAALCLAQIAQDYYDLNLALDYYQMALSSTAREMPAYGLCHALIADTLVKQGYHHAERIFMHAEQGLECLAGHPLANIWQPLLSQYLLKAREQMSGATRLLN
ncbi:MAG: hypothetical protein R2865_05405 [Deinococcales bacterium]